MSLKKAQLLTRFGSVNDRFSRQDQDILLTITGSSLRNSVLSNDPEYISAGYISVASMDCG